MSLLLFILGIAAVRPQPARISRHRPAGREHRNALPRRFIGRGRVAHHADSSKTRSPASKGVERMNSSSRDERSQINVEFTLDRDLDGAANDVRERLSRVARRLPLEADPPRDHQGRQRHRSHRVDQRFEHPARRAGTHRLHDPLPRRPVRDARGRGLRARERRAPLRDARVAVAREPRGAPAHGGGRREFTAARERRAARRAASNPPNANSRCAPIRTCAPRRIPQPGGRPRTGRLPGAAR